MSIPTPRKPDYQLRALHKKTEAKGTVGAAWLNENGSISIVLDSFVTLTQDGSLVLTLFKREERK